MIDHTFAVPLMCASAYAHPTHGLFKHFRKPLVAACLSIAYQSDRTFGNTASIHSPRKNSSITVVERTHTAVSGFDTRSDYGRMANSLPRTMASREQRNELNTSTQSAGGQQLTATNLTAHNQNTRAMPAGQAVRSWLNDIDTSDGRHVNEEAWTRLVARDPLAADIEATVRGGNQNGTH